MKLSTISDLLVEKKSYSKIQNLISVKSHQSINYALELLDKNNILCVPVIDNSSKFIGFIDVLDICSFALQMHSRGEKTEQLLKCEVLKILNYSKIDSSFVVRESFSLQSVFDFFTKPSYSYPIVPSGHEDEGPKTVNRFPHRVAVLNCNEELIDIISQWDLAFFLEKRRASLSENILNSKIGSIKELIHPIVKIRIDEMFSEALEKMCSNRLRGIAVVDENGHIDGQLSSSDLRGVHASSFEYFNSSINMFLFKGLKSKQNYKPRSLTCGLENSLGDVLSLLIKEHIHGVYIVDGFNRPVGYLSIGELLYLLTPAF